MAGAATTFEDIDQFLKGADLSAFEQGGRHYLTAEQARADPAAALAAICPVYRFVRPILQALTTVSLISTNWKGVIRAFVGVMDQICPSVAR